MSETQNTETNQTRHAVFTMGLPGSGKTYVAAKRLNLDAMIIVDPDAFKMTHPDYDAKNPGALHGWSNEQAENLLTETLNEATTDIFIDGTGVNAEKMVRRMNQAKAAGYSVEILYVKVALEVALKRNASRDRVVPEHIVREKALDIVTSFEIASKHADTVTVVENN